MKVIVDQDRCVGNGICEALAPDLFEVGDSGQAHLLVDEIPSEHEQLAHTAVQSCPALALRIDC
ncbi:ferredoxin [Mycobacterium sp. TNTM28]|uniref:Ferredoxin n=1 Tax=[Mycobacterium] fortunisiensis TaxID=2600579 RepID=A0ABS6KJR9_9MYCO|nr:ferredoxin [[Mycobacterium] fortunisiensis]MBU9763822.1 ferredoxin [[Mycobacterium] fortunisiensis]